MSQNISLIEYSVIADGRLYEDCSAVIETAFISPDLLETIKKNFSFEEKIVYEERDSNESSPTDCIKNEDIANVQELLEREFIRLIESNDTQSLKKLTSSASIHEVIEKFRTIANLRHIFWLKTENFSQKANVLIKLG